MKLLYNYCKPTSIKTKRLEWLQKTEATVHTIYMRVMTVIYFAYFRIDSSAQSLLRPSNPKAGCKYS